MSEDKTPEAKGTGKDRPGRDKDKPASGKTGPGRPPAPKPGPANSAGRPAPEASRQARRGSGAAVAMAVLALIIAVATAVGGYFLWHETQGLLRAQSRSQSQQLQGLQSRVGSLGQRLDSALNSQKQQVQDLGKRQDTLEQSVDQLRARLGRSSEGWALAEVQYVLRIANRSLQLQGDVPTTIAALRAADRRLQALGDPGLLPVRKALAKEVSELKAVPEPDLSGMAVKLNSLIQQVPKLRLASGQVLERKAPTPNGGQASQHATSWRELPGVIWRAVRQLVEIRHHNKPVGPMLPPREAYFLYQNLRLQLESARLAGLQRAPDAYRASLTTAQQWLGTYFDPSDAATQAMKDQLQQLAGMDVNPKLPDISASLRLLRQRIQALESQGAPASSEGGAGSGSATPEAPAQ